MPKGGARGGAAYLLAATSVVTETGQRAYAPTTLARWVASIGMSVTDITRLRRRAVTVTVDGDGDGDVLVVTTRGGGRFRIAPDPDTADNPAVVVYRRWSEIQSFLDQFPGTHLLRHHLTDPAR